MSSYYFHCEGAQEYCGLEPVKQGLKFSRLDERRIHYVDHDRPADGRASINIYPKESYSREDVTGSSGCQEARVTEEENYYQTNAGPNTEPWPVSLQASLQAPQ